MNYAASAGRGQSTQLSSFVPSLIEQLEHEEDPSSSKGDQRRSNRDEGDSIQPTRTSHSSNNNRLKKRSAEHSRSDPDGFQLDRRHSLFDGSQSGDFYWNSSSRSSKLPHRVIGEQHSNNKNTDGNGNGDGSDGDSFWRRNMTKIGRVVRRHALFIGPGLLAVTGYTDPGNWATNLQAGSSSGYNLLFVVLLASLFAIVLQVLCVRLGVVTGLDLAQASRQLILGKKDAQSSGIQSMRKSWEALCEDQDGGGGDASWQLRRKQAVWILRRAVLWGLYIVCEGAIVATELAELIGSAIALNLLFPGLPLWGGVLVTSVDVFLILLVYRPEKGTRLFEALIAALVGITLVCFIILVIRVNPNWPDVFYGYVPTSRLIDPGSLYIAVGIIGATIMPHCLILASHFSCFNRLATKVDREARLPAASTAQGATIDSVSEAEDLNEPRKGLRGWGDRILLRFFPAIDLNGLRATRGAAQRVPTIVDSSPNGNASDAPPRSTRLSLELIRIHLPHATFDIVVSLFSFALVINSLILIVAGAAFYYGNGGGAAGQVGDLFDAFALLETYVGRGSAILFAIALLASAQSASIAVTLSGQIVSEGFIHWKLSPFMRRLITRLIAMIPSLTVAAAVGRDGLDEMVGVQC